MKSVVTNLAETKLERLAAGIKTALEAATGSRDTWAKWMVAAAVQIAEARGLYPSDIAFGQWVGVQEFHLSKDDQAAMIHMGEDPDLMLSILNSTDRSSIRLIYKEHQDRFRSVAKPTGKKRGPKPGSVKKQPTVYIDPPIWAEFKKYAEEHNTSAAALMGDVMAMLVNGEDIKPEKLPKTSQEKLAAALRQQTKVLEAQFEQRRLQDNKEHVERLKKEFFPKWKEDADRAYQLRTRYQEMLNNHKPIFTADEYNALLRIAHPDSRMSVSNERLAAAFRLLSDKKFQLTGEK